MRTADTTVVHQVTWPHEVIYFPSAQPAISDQHASMAIVDGYITVMSREAPNIKVLILTHLQELMENGNTMDGQQSGLVHDVAMPPGPASHTGNVYDQG